MEVAFNLKNNRFKMRHAPYFKPSSAQMENRTMDKTNTFGINFRKLLFQKIEEGKPDIPTQNCQHEIDLSKS